MAYRHLAVWHLAECHGIEFIFNGFQVFDRNKQVSKLLTIGPTTLKIPNTDHSKVTKFCDKPKDDDLKKSSHWQKNSLQSIMKELIPWLTKMGQILCTRNLAACAVTFFNLGGSSWDYLFQTVVFSAVYSSFSAIPFSIEIR
jgi:hypothetical protein